MLFNSLVFLLFAAVFFGGWRFVRRSANLRWFYIVAASFTFYGWWDWRFLFLIAGSGLLDYVSGLGIAARPRWRKAFLGLSLAGNVGSLAAFKYSGFLAENLSTLLATVGVDVDLASSIPPFFWILPVGISFYTFQSLSYTIDVYRGRLQPTRNLLHFFAYLALFPQLVAGPIIRASDLLPQLREDRDPTDRQRHEGLRFILHGFFKKMVIADSLAFYVDRAFQSAAISESAAYWWLIVTCFAVQIYCDFSGYSDIARGLARWMGYDFLRNFDHPYVSTSMREFWSRWHISLSTWFRDYVYIPLGGRRAGFLRAEGNMWATMLVSGLWHGAAWTFVAWGGIHALCMSLERITEWPRRVAALPGGRGIALVLVLLQVWISWVFFRATSFGQALAILGQMLSLDGWGLGALRAEFSARVLLNLCVWLGIMASREAYFFLGFHERRWMPQSWRPTVDAVALAVLMAVCIYFRGPGSEFIYFQF